MAHAFGRRRLSGGTPAYMAPEQWEDAPEDERTDVFALGVMLYRMLSGEYPFPEGQGKWAAEGGVPRMLEVPGAPDLAELVEKMLNPVPTQRPRDGAAVLAALTPIEEKLRARPAEGRPPEHARRRKATFGDLLAELKRRHVFRVMIGYGVFAFAVLQVTEPIMHGADLPAWVLKAVLVALALGFPGAVILAWIFDLTAQGVKRTPTASGPPLSRSSRFLMPLSVAVTVLAIVGAGGGAWYAWKQPGERGKAAPTVAPSIAVLPFADMSPGKDQEYLADGLAEEILNVLGRVDGLKVIGRTSSFFFKGKTVEPGEIGKKLGVNSLLEGSVRRDGNRIRVSAQLVNAVDGARLWSESYDREMGAVLAIQDDVARDVASALRVRMVLAAREPGNPAPEAYSLYLQGEQILRQDDGTDGTDAVARAIAAYKGAVAADPTLAPAWARLSTILLVQDCTNSGCEERNERAAREAAARAIELAPGGSEGYSARGWQRMQLDRDWDGARSDIEKAIRLKPGDGHAIARLGLVDAALGRLDDAIQDFKKSVELDPLSPARWTELAGFLNAKGDYAGARAAARAAAAILPTHEGAKDELTLADLLDGHGDRVLVAASQDKDSEYRLYWTALAEHSLGHPQAAASAREQYVSQFGAENPYRTARLEAWHGRLNQSFASLDRSLGRGFVGGVGSGFVRFDPLLRNLHSDPRWKELLQKMNLPVD
jgi:TolB-like protein/Flp pilus assembly protein TadD